MKVSLRALVLVLLSFLVALAVRPFPAGMARAEGTLVRNVQADLDRFARQKDPSPVDLQRIEGELLDWVNLLGARGDDPETRQAYRAIGRYLGTLPPRSRASLVGLDATMAYSMARFGGDPEGGRRWFEAAWVGRQAEAASDRLTPYLIPYNRYLLHREGYKLMDTLADRAADPAEVADLLARARGMLDQAARLEEPLIRKGMLGRSLLPSRPQPFTPALLRDCSSALPLPLIENAELVYARGETGLLRQGKRLAVVTAAGLEQMAGRLGPGTAAVYQAAQPQEHFQLLWWTGEDGRRVEFAPATDPILPREVNRWCWPHEDVSEIALADFPWLGEGLNPAAIRGALLEGAPIILLANGFQRQDQGWVVDLGENRFRLAHLTPGAAFLLDLLAGAGLPLRGEAVCLELADGPGELCGVLRLRVIEALGVQYQGSSVVPAMTVALEDEVWQPVQADFQPAPPRVAADDTLAEFANPLTCRGFTRPWVEPGQLLQGPPRDQPGQAILRFHMTGALGLTGVRVLHSSRPELDAPAMALLQDLVFAERSVREEFLDGQWTTVRVWFPGRE